MHSHETRQKNYIHIAGTRTTSAKQCIRQYIPTVLTSIPTLVSDKITTHSYAGFSRYAKQYFIQLYKFLGVRSLANTSRARQFNPLNPPGVGWVNFFFYPHMRAKFGRSPSRKILTIDNPLNPPGVFFFKGESIYPHMRAKFGRGLSRKIFNNR